MEMTARYWKLLSIAILGLMFVMPGLASDRDDDQYVHAIKFKVNGEYYYLAGAPDGPNGATDIPGHYWLQTDKKSFLGRHFNTGPGGLPAWWSSDVADGALLYIVIGKIDTWSQKKADMYYAKGFTHYHEMVSVETGELHPEKVIWLKHVAATDFTLNGGPHPEYYHAVTRGVDYNFIPNGYVPYVSY